MTTVFWLPQRDRGRETSCLRSCSADTEFLEIFFGSKYFLEVLIHSPESVSDVMDDVSQCESLGVDISDRTDDVADCVRLCWWQRTHCRWCSVHYRRAISGHRWHPHIICQYYSVNIFSVNTDTGLSSVCAKFCVFWCVIIIFPVCVKSVDVLAQLSNDDNDEVKNEENDNTTATTSPQTTDTQMND